MAGPAVLAVGAARLGDATSAWFDECGVPVDMRDDLANADDEESWQPNHLGVLP